MVEIGCSGDKTGGKLITKVIRFLKSVPPFFVLFELVQFQAMRIVRNGLPDSLAFVANGDIQEFDDFDRVMKLTGARAAMSGYGALLNPGGMRGGTVVFMVFLC